MGEWQGNEKDRHQLTIEDRQKGGQAISERKQKANAINPLKHGRLAKSPYMPDEFINCNNCKHRKSCSFYHKDASCKIVGIEPMKILVKLYGVSGIELLQVINKELVAYGIKAKSSDSLSEQRNWVRLLMEFFKLKFGSKELIVQVSKTLSDEEFESLIEIYQRKVLMDERKRKKKRAAEAVV